MGRIVATSTPTHATRTPHTHKHLRLNSVQTCTHIRMQSTRTARAYHISVRNARHQFGTGVEGCHKGGGGGSDSELCASARIVRGNVSHHPEPSTQSALYGPVYPLAKRVPITPAPKTPHCKRCNTYALVNVRVSCPLRVCNAAAPPRHVFDCVLSVMFNRGLESVVWGLRRRPASNLHSRVCTKLESASKRRYGV